MSIKYASVAIYTIYSAEISISVTTNMNNYYKWFVICERIDFKKCVVLFNPKSLYRFVNIYSKQALCAINASDCKNDRLIVGINSRCYLLKLSPIWLN